MLDNAGLGADFQRLHTFQWDVQMLLFYCGGKPDARKSRRNLLFEQNKFKITSMSNS